ncbi:MAG: hypothetical protein JWM11_7953 [Planctomycetaceae bacterium]|nr:hypothetical protein [Planctomycetaceae bacterium]
MAKNFFRLTSDAFGGNPVKRWQLTFDPALPDGSWWDFWAYQSCRSALPPLCSFSVFEPGPPSEVNFTGAFGILVVSQRIASVIEAIGFIRLMRA